MSNVRTGEPAAHRYGARFAEALAFATAAHEAQHRKASGVPYITHPLAVASLVGEYGGDEDLAIAGLLHDAIEDCGVVRDELARRFGDRVATVVEGCTEPLGPPRPPWRTRKETHAARVRVAEPDVKLVVAADKLHNATSILRDAARASVGPRVWDRFRASRSDVIGSYRSMLTSLGSSWRHEILDELARTVDALELSR